MVISGTEGHIEFNIDKECEIILQRGEGKDAAITKEVAAPLEPVSVLMGVPEGVRRFIDTLESGVPDRDEVARAVNSHMTANAAERSIDSGQWETVTES